MKKIARLAFLTIFTLLLTTSTSSISPSLAAPVTTLQNGADVSWLPEIERAGSKFYDARGRKIDPLVLMKQVGVENRSRAALGATLRSALINKRGLGACQAH
jgi:arabinogalactan endo-1,4-beta-galactosidase